MQEISMST